MCYLLENNVFFLLLNSEEYPATREFRMRGQTNDGGLVLCICIGISIRMTLYGSMSVDQLLLPAEHYFTFDIE